MPEKQDNFNLDLLPTFFAGAEQDTKVSPVTRPRTQAGDRVTTTAVYSIPGAGREPLDHSKYPDLIRQIADHYPVYAQKLLHDYADKLIPAALDVEKERVKAEADLKSRQAAAAESELRYQAVAEAIEADIEKAYAPFASQRKDLVEAIAAARTAAAETCGKIGVKASDETTEIDILAVPVVSREKAAQMLDLPVNVTPPTASGKVLTMLGTVLVGIVSGVSAGLAAGILDAKSLEYQLGKLVAAAIVGVGFSAFARYAILTVFKTAAESKYSNRPKVEVVGKFAQAYTALAAAIAMYTAMERQGLLKLADAQNAVKSLSNLKVEHVPSYVLYVMAALITFGYVAFSAAQGYREGRDTQANSRIDSLVDDLHHQASEARHNDPLVAQALTAVSHLQYLLKQLGELDAKVEAALAPIYRRLAEAEAQRQPYPNEISDYHSKLIQDSLDQYHGTQLEIDVVLNDLIEKIEGREGFFKRLLYAIFPRMRARKRRTFKAVD